METPPKNSDYLGDGVYASFDGYHIWLWTRRDFDWHRIALEDSVFSALLRYASKVHNQDSSGA
jgi:hypothetical protein